MTPMSLFLILAPSQTVWLNRASLAHETLDFNNFLKVTSIPTIY
jgi:hypothetical protein